MPPFRSEVKPSDAIGWNPRVNSPKFDFTKPATRLGDAPHNAGASMSEAFIELLFWMVIFVVFFFGFKWLQNRKKRKEAEKEK